MSGGNGERLWPFSRQNMPKQFGSFLKKPLLQKSLERFKRYSHSPIVVTVQSQKNIIKNMDYMKGIEALYEPCGKNTAPAIALLCRKLELEGLTNEVVGVFSADHHIKNEFSFHKAVTCAEEQAKAGSLVTLGVAPDHPATGFGYIELSKNEQYQPQKVLSFKEKPSKEVAEKYLAQGNYVWNAGIFIFKVSSMIELFKQHMPELWQAFSKLDQEMSQLEEIYNQVQSVSIDYGILEHVTNLHCVPCDIGWMDLGSWDEIAKLDKEELIDSSSHIETVRAENNFVFSHKKKTHTLIDVENLIVVDTEDALLIAKKGSTQSVKNVVNQLKEKKNETATKHQGECRPWGKYESLLEEDNFKLKKITVLPGERLSYQAHNKRSEHWILVSGQAEFTLDDQSRVLNAGEHAHIPKESKHRIKNIGTVPLIFVEVQLGSYFGEDDIIRYSDDYGRAA